MMVEWLGDLLDLLWIFGDGLPFGGDKKKKEQRNRFMAVVQIEGLPDSSRALVFGSQPTLVEEKTQSLKEKVDAFLNQRKADRAGVHVGLRLAEWRLLPVVVCHIV